VATKGEVICFVEVKTRRQAYFAISSVVTGSKQQKIAKAAKIFVAQNKIADKVLRFDVATVVVTGSYQPMINYLENAFCAATYSYD
jgi:Holliday junction resolvase-like predicted endonuclease